MSSGASDVRCHRLIPLGCADHEVCETPLFAAGRQMYVVIVSFLWIALFTPSVAAQTPPGSASSVSVSGPTFDEGSVQRIREALATYLEIEKQRRLAGITSESEPHGRSKDRHGEPTPASIGAVGRSCCR